MIQSKAMISKIMKLKEVIIKLFFIYIPQLFIFHLYIGNDLLQKEAVTLYCGNFFLKNVHNHVFTIADYFVTFPFVYRVSTLRMIHYFYLLFNCSSGY